jgi:hypothetical protein
VDWREASTPLVQWIHHRGGVAPALGERQREMIPTANNPRHTGVSFEHSRMEENVLLCNILTIIDLYLVFHYGHLTAKRTIGKYFSPLF